MTFISIELAVLLVLSVLYLIYIGFVKYTDKVSLPKNFELYGPLLMYKTKNGIEYFESLAIKYEKAWDRLGFVGSMVTFSLMLVSSIFIIYSSYIVVTNPPEETITSPQNYLVIPGVNEFLPLSVAFEILFALAIGMIIHEGGHAIYCKLGDIEIDSMGLLFFSIIPFGAFVEPDMEDQEKANTYDRLKMTSAGIVNNIILTIVAVILLLFFGLAISSVGGVAIGGVFDGTPADQAGLQAGDSIVSIQGEEIGSETEFSQYLMNNSERNVSVTTTDGDEYIIERELIFERITDNSAVNIHFSTGDDVIQVDGKEMYTTAELQQYIQSEHTGTTIQFSNEEGSNSVPLGAATTIQRESATNANLSQRDTILILSVEGERVKSGSEAVTKLTQENNSEITYLEGESGVEQTATVTDRDSLLVHSGYSGIQFTDMGISAYPVDTFSQLINPIDSETSMGQWLLLFFILPFATLVGLQYNFFGISGLAESFYTTGIETIDPVAFLLWNVLYWTAWININLAIFNCIPMPFVDGKYIVEDGLTVIGDKLPVEVSENVMHSLAQVIRAATLMGLVAIIVVSLIQ